MRRALAVGGLCFMASCTGGDSAPLTPPTTPLSPEGARQTLPWYSPDGKRIAYWSPATDSSGNWQLWLARADLTEPRRLAVALQIPQRVVWSPDGTRLATASSDYGMFHVVVVN